MLLPARAASPNTTTATAKQQHSSPCPRSPAATPCAQLPRNHCRKLPGVRRALRAGAFAPTGVSTATIAPPRLYLGLDFGTSGARAAVIDDEGTLVQDVKRGYGDGAEADWAGAWRRVLFELIGSLDPAVRSSVASVAFDGTSATAMLVDPRDGTPLAPPKLYNEAQGRDVVAAAKAMAPPAHTATAPTSTLCKLLTWWYGTDDGAAAGGGGGGWRRVAAERGLATPGPGGGAAAAGSAAPSPLLLHQADWLAALLHGVYGSGVTDWNNALKLGYDPELESYPAWLAQQRFAPLLPARVVAPGAPVASLDSRVSAACGLPPGCLVCGGTTDSIAAFVAAGVTEAGQAVTSLGSTLAVKLLSTTRVDDAAYGVYSHRLGDVWLVGGASNSGGAVLRRFFNDQQLRELTPRLDADRPTGLDYYPLPGPGERFPVADPELQPRMSPRPEDDALFLQGLLEGIAQIEAAAYGRLAAMGASPLRQVLTAGGGAANPKWTAIRQRLLGVPVRAAEQGEACYGAALLARQGARQAAAAASAAAAAAATAAPGS
ncbi:hypothetical protein PLESTB_001760900 [Pleodorina starrii]|uniref:D-ribulose kinase n=1 Tax=Pleodorina starrii TaxID=330485 RepID=A0A9W6C031_9CHLO|nr:hypothetical protein PLESTM_000602500 [Pleodorina starrii]GLC61479.1 hypothetical protein PLESTB_001760900 [Pleodorina starrii]GLC74119.1 hypothetical protein PLESTF_001462000 [Pleodorina starrii]